MKHPNRLLLSVIAAISVPFSLVHGFGPKTFFKARSQGLAAYRSVIGTAPLNYAPADERCYTLLSATVEYAHSRKPADLSNWFFGGCSRVFSGSQVPNRQATDILADNFGLPTDFKSSLHICPSIRTVVTDLVWYQGLDAYAPGAYLQVDVPFMYSLWDLSLQEVIANAGTAFYPAGYMSNSRIERAELPLNVMQALQGGTTFGDMREPMEYGTIFGGHAARGVADINLTFGVNVSRGVYHQLGLFSRCTIPTGRKSDARHLFEPTMGNSRHFEIGGGVTAFLAMMESNDGEHRIAFSTRLYAGYVAPAHEKRSFDFKFGNGSRYMLLEEIMPPSVNLQIGGLPNRPTSTQYKGRLVPAINLTTFDTVITVGAQADLLVMATYTHRHFSFDMGYNLWVRGAEGVRSRGAFPSDRFGLKGDAMIYAFTDPAEVPVALNATQSKATIYAGQTPGNANYQNNNVDNAATAVDTTGALFNLKAADATALGLVQTTPNTSDGPIFITDADINCSSALMPRSVSQTVFAHLQHTWHCQSPIEPFLGGGLTVTWADLCAESNGSHAQWSLLAKIGASF